MDAGDVRQQANETWRKHAAAQRPCPDHPDLPPPSEGERMYVTDGAYGWYYHKACAEERSERIEREYREALRRRR